MARWLNHFGLIFMATVVFASALVAASYMNRVAQCETAILVLERHAKACQAVLIKNGLAYNFEAVGK